MTRRGARTLAALAVLAAAALAVALGRRDRPPTLRVPAVEGPLRLRVAFPDSGAVAAVPSGYVIGSVGSGRARLAIDGVPVPVLPNGAFFAYLPSPPGSRPAYRLRAWLDGESAAAVVPLASWAEALRGDSAAVQPRGPLQVRAGERVPVVVRAPVDARVWLAAAGVRRPLAREHGAWLVLADEKVLRGNPSVVVQRGRDTVRLRVPAAQVLPPGRRWGTLGDAGGRAHPEGVPARVVPGGAYRWSLLPGTRVEVTGRRGSERRVRLDEGQEAWVADSLVRMPAPESARPAAVRRAGGVVVAGGPGWTDVGVPLDGPAPFLVEERDGGVTLTLYGTRGAPGIVSPPGGGWVRGVRARPEGGPRVRYDVDLAGPPYAYRVAWQPGRMVLRLRHPPAADRRSPLRGRVVAVDPGHPPGGAVGPTGLREAEVALAVALRLERILRERGARAVLTRRDAAPVELEARQALALGANAEALVSIHLDSTPAEVDPRTEAGTATHYYHAHSLALARAVQAGVARRMGLGDRGVSFINLAMLRPAWVPAVLCEGATLVLPAQEAALRTPEFQEAYARGIADGLEAYFASLAPR